MKYKIKVGENYMMHDMSGRGTIKKAKKMADIYRNIPGNEKLNVSIVRVR